MILVDLIEIWAKDKGFWTHKGTNYGNVPYINICKVTPGRPNPDVRKIVTVWDSGTVNFPGNHRNVDPADPDFFPSIERLLPE